MGQNKEVKKISNLAIASIIFGVLISPIGIILGIAALIKISKNPQLSGKGLAITGIILGVIFLPVFLFVTFIIYSLGQGFYHGRYGENECKLSEGFVCKSFSLDSNGNLEITVLNNIGNLQNITLNLYYGGLDGHGVTCLPKETALKENEEEVFNCKISKGDPGDSYLDIIKGEYIESGAKISHKFEGTIRTKYQ